MAIQSWRDDIQGFLVVRAYYPSFLFGVSQSNFDFFSTISYQFYHEGFLHFLGNVLLILIIGGYLERRYSGFMVFSVYIVGGSLAAYFFSFVAGLNGSPLVGASGSLCALLGVLLAFEFQHKNVKNIASGTLWNPGIPGSWIPGSLE